MNPIQRTLERAVWLLSGISLAAIVLTEELGLTRSLIYPALWALFFFLDNRQRLPSSGRAQTALAAAFLVFSAARVLIFRDPFLLVVADFLIAFLLTKGAFAKNPKDLRQMMALSFFVLLAAASLSLNISFLMAFVGYTLMGAVTLSLFCLSKIEPSAPGPDRSLRPMVPTLLRTTWVSLACAFGLAALMFVFFPRWSAAVFQGTFLGPLRRSGYTETVNLREAGDITLDPRIVMRVETSDPWDGYLRGATLTRFDGRGWSAEPGLLTLLSGPRLVENQYIVPGPVIKRQGPLRRQKIYLEAMDSPTLFTAPWARQIHVTLPRLFVGEDKTLRRPSEHRGRLAYTAYSDARPAVGDPLTLAVREKTLRLPADVAASPRLRALAASLISRSDTDAQKAAKLTEHFQKTYGYSLERKTDPAAQPLESFLFDVKKGHCEHFASALAVLLRLEGVPARIVSGFHARERNDAGGHFVVRAQDAHAWVEAWTGDRWTVHDPTPVERFTPPRSTVWHRWRERWEYVNFLWNRHVLSYDLESQRGMAITAIRTSQRWEMDFRRLSHSWRSVFRGKGTRPQSGQTVWLFWAVAALALGLAVFYRKRKGGTLHPKAAHDAVWFYREALALAARQGHRRDPAETAEEFKTRLAAHPRWGEALAFLTPLYHQARFSGAPLPPHSTAAIRSTLAVLRLPNLRTVPMR